MQKNASLAQVTAIGDATAAVRRTAPGVKSDHILSVVAVCENEAATDGFAPERRVCLRTAVPSRDGTVSVEIRVRGMQLDAASRKALQAAFSKALFLAWEFESLLGEMRRKALFAPQ